MRRVGATVTLLLAGPLLGCGGGSTSSSVPAAPAGWIAALRYNPTTVQLRLSRSDAQYMYVDAGATNGAYPSAATFGAQIEAANPTLYSGSCSKIARMWGTTMTFTDARGTTSPSYVVAFAPTATGSCTQSINLGAEGTGSFTVAVAN